MAEELVISYLEVSYHLLNWYWFEKKVLIINTFTECQLCVTPCVRHLKGRQGGSTLFL